MNIIIHPAIAISCGAIAGALSRYYLGAWLTTLWGNAFPVGTFGVNILGSFLMGAIAALITSQIVPLPETITLLITVGFLGSFTTFSSYMLDSAKLLDAGRSQGALLYWLGSPVCGFLGLRAGRVLSRWLADTLPSP